MPSRTAILYLSLRAAFFRDEAPLTVRQHTPWELDDIPSKPTPGRTAGLKQKETRYQFLSSEAWHPSALGGVLAAEAP